jgi:hypothetical protein
MIRNYKTEEKLKEMGIKDPQSFIRWEMLENKFIEENSHIISFNFVVGLITGILITLMFI